MAENETEDRWQCSICFELLYKPTAAPCSHLFCFWCSHRSMSPFSVSKCPLCRSPLSHFPAVCYKLHEYLKASFPESYERRRLETSEEEAVIDTASPDVDLANPPSDHVDGTSIENFSCDTCNQLLHQPAVLNCGHAVCRSTCMASQLQPPSTSAAKSSNEDSSIKVKCSKCSLVSPKVPAVCMALDELVQRRFPTEAAARAQQAEAYIQQHGTIESKIHTLTSVGQFITTMRTAFPEATRPPPPAAATTTTPAAEALAAIPEVSAAIGADSDNQQASLGDSLLAKLTGKAYTHFGVGCDICGQYPIQGNRYKCKDCPESVGFDICGSCMDAGVPNIVGRFNQKHTADHELELVRPRITGLHMLQLLNPELSAERLMHLLELAQEDDGAPPPAPAARQDQQQQQEEEEGGTTMLSVLPRGGPRPAADPDAVWPSPSVGVTDADQQQQQNGQQDDGNAEDDHAMH